MEVPLTLPTIVHLCLGDRLPGHASIIEGCGQIWRQDLGPLIAAGAHIVLERTARPASRRLEVHLRSGVSRSTREVVAGSSGMSDDDFEGSLSLAGFEHQVIA